MSAFDLFLDGFLVAFTGLALVVWALALVMLLLTRRA
jgi:hypothetical protein